MWIILRILFVAVAATLIPWVHLRAIFTLNNYSSKWREYSLNSACCIIKYLDLKKELVDTRISKPNVAGSQSYEQVQGMMQLIRFDICQTCEGICLIAETIGLRRQLTFLILKLQILIYFPVMIAAIRYGDELIATLLIIGVWVPSSGFDWNWNHRLTENVLVSINKVPHCNCRYDLFFTLASARNNE